MFSPSLTVGSTGWVSAAGSADANSATLLSDEAAPAGSPAGVAIQVLDASSSGLALVVAAAPLPAAGSRAERPRARAHRLVVNQAIPRAAWPPSALPRQFAPARAQLAKWVHWECPRQRTDH